MIESLRWRTPGRVVYLAQNACTSLYPAEPKATRWCCPMDGASRPATTMQLRSSHRGWGERCASCARSAATRDQRWKARKIPSYEVSRAVCTTGSTGAWASRLAPQWELPHDPAILRTVNQQADGACGVYLRARGEAVISEGDAVEI